MAQNVVSLDELELGLRGTIRAMVCRKWDVSNTKGKYLSTDFLLSDQKGNVAHCIAKSNIAHCFVNKLQDGMIYSIKGFNVLPNKDEYRILKDSKYIIELQGSSYVSKINSDIDGFVRHPFQFVDLHAITPTEKKYFIDVMGYVVSIGKVVTQSNGSNTLDFSLCNDRGYKVRVTLWGKLGDELIRKKGVAHGVYAVILTSMTAKYYMGDLCLSSSSSTLIIDDLSIPVLAAFKSKLGDVSLIEENESTIDTEPRDATVAEILEWAHTRKAEMKLFKCRLRMTNIWTKNSWYYLTCASGKCKKGVSRKDGNFWCDSCEQAVTFPRPRYRLQVDVSNGTASTVIVMFDETAEQLVKSTAQALLDSFNEDVEEGSDLPNALANLINTTHVFAINTASYYEHGTYESFNCVRVYPSITSCDDLPLGTQAVVPCTLTKTDAVNEDTLVVTPTKPTRRLKRSPTTDTPSKPSDPKKISVCIDDDSDSDVAKEGPERIDGKSLGN